MIARPHNPQASVTPISYYPNVANVISSRDRAVGALVGLACGDAVGTTLEFKLPGTFTPITDMFGGGPFTLKPGQFTDDTSMALCLGESILDTAQINLSDQLRRYVLWQSEGYLSSNGRCFDIGNTVAQALRRFETTGESFEQVPNQNSAANGSLMRLAPVPIRWHANIEDAIEQSAESSRSTHAARRPVDACRVFGALIAALISGQDDEQVFAEDFWQYGELDPEIEAIVRGSWKSKQPRGSGFCVHALEAALWAVGGAENFREAILRAANLGEDADTTAAIAGQLAGARWGVGNIPQEWRDKLVTVERITAMADALWLSGSGSPSEATAWGHDEFLHAWWVQPGLLAGEFPGDKDPLRAAQKVNMLVDSGIRSFIDLTTPEDHLEPYVDHVTQAATNRQLDIRQHSFGITDLSIASDDVYDEITRMIAAEQSRGGVYVHCWGGVGRTGTVVGCALIDSGSSYVEAIKRIGELRAGTHKADRPCPETEPQHQVIRDREHKSSS